MMVANAYAFRPWGTPAALGTFANTSNPTSMPFASVTVAAGKLIVIGGAISVDTATITCSDSGSNTYTVRQLDRTSTNPDQSAFIAYARATTALSAGTITVAWGGGASASAVGGAYSVSGVIAASPEDTAAYASGIDTSDVTNPSIVSETPAFANDFFLGVGVSDSEDETYTEASGWNTLIGKTVHIAGPNFNLAMAYKINPTASALTWQPTTAADNHLKLIAAFKKAA